MFVSCGQITYVLALLDVGVNVAASNGGSAVLEEEVVALNLCGGY